MPVRLTFPTHLVYFGKVLENAITRKLFSLHSLEFGNTRSALQLQSASRLPEAKEELTIVDHAQVGFLLFFFILHLCVEAK